MSRWECAVCGHIHTGNQPPTSCPVCGAPSNRFTRLGDAVGYPGSLPVEKKKIIIVGGGISGYTAAARLRELSEDCEIDLYSEEPDLPYIRMNLTRVLSGELPQQDLSLRPESWYSQQRISLHAHCRVTKIDATRKRIVDDSGNKGEFDDLILCSGARARIPEPFQVSPERILTLRTWQDLRRIEEMTRIPREIVCLGGGVLGVEIAAALAQRGHKIRLVYNDRQLLPRQLNRGASERLESLLRERHVSLTAETEVQSVAASKKLQLRLSGGRRIGCDLLLLATGVLADPPPCTPHLPAPCPVDTRMASALKGIWAAGDGAVIAGRSYGSWGPAQRQGDEAARSVLGMRSDYVNPVPTCLIKVVKPEIISIGDIRKPHETIELNRHDFLISLFFQHRRLCGAILFNASEYAPIINKTISDNRDLSALLHRHPSARDLLDQLNGSD